MKVSSSTSRSKEIDLPLPSQLFSLIPTAKDPPVVPIPAPAEISPVGCSSTVIFMILRLFFDPSTPRVLLF